MHFSVSFLLMNCYIIWIGNIFDFYDIFDFQYIFYCYTLNPDLIELSLIVGLKTTLEVMCDFKYLFMWQIFKIYNFTDREKHLQMSSPSLQYYVEMASPCSKKRK